MRIRSHADPEPYYPQFVHRSHMVPPQLPGMHPVGFLTFFLLWKGIALISTKYRGHVTWGDFRRPILFITTILPQTYSHLPPGTAACSNFAYIPVWPSENYFENNGISFPSVDILASPLSFDKASSLAGTMISAARFPCFISSLASYYLENAIAAL